LKLDTIDSLLKIIRKTGTVVWRVAVEDLVLSQEDKPKKSPSAREISHETANLCSSVYRIIHLDFQFKWFKQRRVQLLSKASRISRLTR